MCLRKCIMFCAKIQDPPRLVHFHEEATFYDLTETKNILDHPKFDKRKKTVMYIHGFVDNVESINTEVIVRAYRTRNDYNILAVDWRQDALPDYFDDAVPSIDQIGYQVARKLLLMFANGLDIEQFHIVGFSLGAQMAGVIGRYIKDLSSNRKKLKRITALDPAYPAFEGRKKHLSETDADFVDVIHTDSGFLGYPESTGTVDFWPNSGRAPQPGCRRFPLSKHACSHTRCCWYWAESVNSNIFKFIAIKANSWEDFKAGRTEQIDKEVIVGPDCQQRISGNYYFQTNDSEPYARGEEGVIYYEHKDPSYSDLDEITPVTTSNYTCVIEKEMLRKM